MVSAETGAVVVTVALTVGGAYVDRSQQMTGLRHGVASLEARMSRLEAIIEGWFNAPPQEEAERS